jgi:hypothetical protein
MRQSKFNRGAVVTLGVVALAATACYTANLSGGGGFASQLQAGKGGQFQLISNDVLGTGLGTSRGVLQDNGTNPAWPNGVKLSFGTEHFAGITFGAGFAPCDSTTTTSTVPGSSTTVGGVTGPSRAVHAQPAKPTPPSSSTTTPGSTSTTISPWLNGGGDGCGTWPHPQVWFGLATYSSTDTKHYPNVINPLCTEEFYYYLHDGPTAPTPTQAQLDEEPHSGTMSGFAVVLIADTNLDGNPDKGDAFTLGTVCGPYSNLPAPAAPAGATSGPFGPGNVYSYGTCPATNSVPGGVIPGEAANPEALLSFLGANNCFVPLTSGNLKIGVAVDYGGSGPIPN